LAWAGGAVGAGVAISVAAVAVPARRQARTLTVAGARAAVGRPGRPLPLRWGLDGWLLAAAAVVFWLTSRSGYNLVLAPEGVPSVSVSYWSLAGPLLLWAGAGLAAWRAAEALLGRGSGLVRAALRPLARGLAGPVAATLRRQRRTVAGGAVLVALTVAFAGSTAAFNATYRQQVAVDALLTNGADVTVTGAPTATAPPGDAARLARVPGVRHVEGLQHRFAYVGADLQDLYGVDPATIVGATKLQDAYFAGGTARSLMAELARHPDAALVSAETVHDFQLQPGDLLRLRLRDAGTGQLREVAFHYAGVVKEFPTAPTDSFVVANAAYVGAATADPAPDAFLLATGGASPHVVAGRVRRLPGTGPVVTDVETGRRIVGSSLTAVDLSGLTRLELGYALLLTVAATGLVLLLGLAERRRSFTIAAALGARPGQIGAFVRAEALVLAGTGLAAGAAAGWALSHMLVKVLTGVFDPPPAHLAVPWAYLGAVAVLAAVAVVAASQAAIGTARRPFVETLRDL
jgi:putative ABC transport system permease protein